MKLIAPNGKPSKLNAVQYKLVRTPEFKEWFGDWEKDPKNASKVVDENGEPLVVYRGMPKKRKFGNIFRYNVKMFGDNKKRQKNEFAFYFTDMKKVAKEYGQNLSDEDDYVVTEYFLNIRNLFQAYTKKNEYEISFKKLYDLANPIKKNVYATDYQGNTLTDYDNKPILYVNQFRTYRNLYLNEANKQPTFYWFVDWSKDESYQYFWRTYLQELLKYDGLVFYEYTHNTKGWDAKKQKFIPQYDEFALTYGVWDSNQIKLADGSNTTFDGSNSDIRFAKGGKTKRKKVKAVGDCYEMAGMFAMGNVFAPHKIDFIGKPYIVHAEVQGQGAISDLRYGHAWVEDDVFVYDYSNNRELTIPKALYYSIGDVNPDNPKKYRKYTFAEARAKMVETRHYGCWDIETEYAQGGSVNGWQYQIGGL